MSVVVMSQKFTHTDSISNIGGGGVSGDGGQAISPEGTARTSANIYSPQYLSCANSNLYITQGSRMISKVTSRNITTVVKAPHLATNVTASTCYLQIVNAMSILTNGTLYITDDHIVRKIKNGVMTVVAGLNFPGNSGDGGLASDAQIYASSMTVNPSGDIFITGNTQAGIIRKITTSTGIITTFATGLHTFGGLMAAASNGDIFLSDSFNGQFVKITATGSVSYYTLPPHPQGYTNEPYGVGVSSTGEVYVADMRGTRVLKYTSASSYSIVVGGNGKGYSGDGGQTTSANFYWITHISITSKGIYVKDANGVSGMVNIRFIGSP